MKAYESSTATLKSILSHPSLDRSNIDRTMEALAEANADAREIDEAVRIGADVAVGNDIDNSDIEAELQDLIRESAAQKEQTQIEEKHAMLAGAGMKPPVRVIDVESDEEEDIKKVPVVQL